MLEAVAAVLQLPNDPKFVFRDDELAYWHLIWTLKDKNLKSSGPLPLQDDMRAKWRTCSSFKSGCFHTIWRNIDPHAGAGSICDGFPSARGGGPPPAMPFLDEIAPTIMSPSSSVGEIVALASVGMFSDPEKAGDLSTAGS